MKASMRARRQGTRKSRNQKHRCGGEHGIAEVLRFHTGQIEHQRGHGGTDQRGA